MTGRTAVDMPELPLAPLQKSVVACHTGPGKGLTDLSQDPDPPSDDVYLDRGMGERERERSLKRFDGNFTRSYMQTCNVDATLGVVFFVIKLV